MASKTISVGNAGEWKIVIDLVSQNISSNYSTIRVRGIMRNTSSVGAHNGYGVSRSLSGTNNYSYSSSGTFSVSGGSSLTFIDRTINVPHSSLGYLTVTYTATLGNTSTWTFGSGGSVTLSVTMPRIAMEPGPPGPPSRSFTAPNKVALTWSAADTNGASIIEYQVMADDNSNFSSPLVVSSSNRSHTYTLTIGKKWYFRVRARNSQGWGIWSNVRSYTIPNVPSAPSKPALSLTPPRTIRVSWSAGSNGGASITGYDVQYSRSSSFSPSSMTTASSEIRSITVPSQGERWYFRVRAKNSQGSSSWSSSSYFNVPDVPGKVSAPSLAYTPATTMQVSWSVPENGGANITGYEMQYAPNSNFSSSKLVNATGSSVVVSDLTLGVYWYFRVRAVNSQGAGEWSTSAAYLVVCGPQVFHNGVWKNTIAYVNVDGVWKLAIPYVNDRGVWKIAGG